MAMEFIPGPNLTVATAPAGDSTNRAASTAFVTAAIAAVPSGPVYIPSGSVLLFFQASAPTGYTQVVTQNDKALRIVSGSGGGTGGSSPFTTVFAQSATGAHTLTTTEMPSHTHSISAFIPGCCGGLALAATGSGVTPESFNTGSNGSGGSHTHTMDIRVQYIDVIICSRN